MHRFIIHAHQLCQAGRLLGSDVIGMKLRTQGSETSILQIEVISGMIILQVGIQTEKTGKAHQEDQMEIGKPLPAFIQPDDGMIQISKQRTVLRLLPDGAIKEFRKKQSDGRFVGIVGKRGERIKRLRLLHLIYSGIRTEIGFKFHQCQRLEEYRLHRRLARTGYGHHEGSPASHLRIDVCNERCILIFQGMQHNSQCFL